MSRTDGARPLDASRLKRSLWTTPVVMSAWVTVPALPAVLDQPKLLPGVLGFAGVIGLCGLLMGLRSNARAKEIVGKAFGVDYLPADHKLSKRVEALAQRLDLPPPTVGIMDATNAFAIGRRANESAVVLGLPLIKMLNDDELDAVIGHELGHIATGDVQRMQIAEGYQTLFAVLFTIMVTSVVMAVAKSRSSARLGLMFGELGRMILGFGSELIVKRLSRTREFYADAIGAALTSPAAMVGALEKLHASGGASSDAEARYG